MKGRRSCVGDLLEMGASLKTGPFGTTLKAHQYTAVGVPLVSVGEIGDGEIVLRDGTPRVGPDVVDELPEYLLEAHDIVFARKGSVDRIALVKEAESGYFLGSDGLRLRVGTSANARFLALQLRDPQIRAWLLRHASGSTLLSMNQETIKRIPITLPERAAQDAISEVLGALDDKIAANERVVRAVDDVCAEAFSRSAGTADSMSLGSIADINMRSVRKVPTGVLRYLDISSVSEGRYDLPAETRWLDAPSRARRELRVGDTIWSTVRPNRRSHALVLDDDPTLIGSTGLAVLTPREVGPAFLYEATKTGGFTDYLVSVAEGSAYPAVRADRFADAPVPDMSDNERNEFEALAMPLRLRAHRALVESRRLAELREALLPHLMSGRLAIRQAEAHADGAL